MTINLTYVGKISKTFIIVLIIILIVDTVFKLPLDKKNQNSVFCDTWEDNASTIKVT